MWAKRVRHSTVFSKLKGQQGVFEDLDDNDLQKLADMSFPGYRRGPVTVLKILMNMWLEGMMFPFTDRVKRDL